MTLMTRLSLTARSAGASVLLAPIAMLAVASCASPDQAFELELGSIEFAGPAGSAEPNLFAADDGRLLMSWHEPTDGESHSLRMAVRTGQGWSEPKTVARDRSFFVNWADFPSIVEQSDGAWVVHWLEKVARAPYAYHVMLSRSTDKGETWSEPLRGHHDISPTEHGFVSMVPLPEGGLSLLFLDGRNTGSDGHSGGAMSLRSTDVGRDGLLGRELLVDDRVCDCCQTAMVRMESGDFVAAYRNRSQGEIRDISISRLTGDSWSDPYLVADDNWHMPACPVNGPSLATSGSDVAIAWFTAPDGDKRVSAAFSDDGAATFGEPIPVDDGNPLGRVDIEMLEDGSAIVIWLERVGDGAEIRAKRVDRWGMIGASWIVTPSSQNRRSGFPRLVSAGGELIFAWTVVGDDGGIRVATASLED